MKDDTIKNFFLEFAKTIGIEPTWGWKTRFIDKIGKNINVNNPELISTWNSRGHIPDLAIEKILAHDMPDSLRELGEKCRKPEKEKIKSPSPGYKNHGGWDGSKMESDPDFQLAAKVLHIINSGTVYARALKSNIDAFYRALKTDTEIDNLKEKQKELMARIAALEKRGTGTGG